jgi:hypothetical protein
MATRGEQHADQLRDALVCPQCEYSLRGLAGDEVNCPECGMHVNIASLITAKWTKPWWDAPLYNTLALPLAWVILSMLAAVVLFAATHRLNMSGELVLPWLGLSAIVWVFLLAYLQRRFGSAEGIWLALLVHLVVPFYMIGILGAIGMTVALLANLHALWVVSLYNFFGLLLFVALFISARLIERFVGHRCIRRHLRLMVEGVTSQPRTNNHEQPATNPS